MVDIAIKISDEVYQNVIKNGFIYDEDGEAISHAIIDGTLLPKCHGRLLILSEDAVKREQVSTYFSCQRWIGDAGLSNATVAIIEADKEK
jgi:hypothetical protein